MNFKRIVKGRELAISCDPAQSIDDSAIALIRLEGHDPGGNPIVRILGVNHTNRQSYDLQTDAVCKMQRVLFDAGANGVAIIIDAGGPGRPVLDAVRARSALSATAIGISTHGGDRTWMDTTARLLRAAKVNVVSNLDSALQSKRLIYHPDAPGASKFLSQVAGLRGQSTASGNIKIAAKGQGHDDYLFAVAQGYQVLAQATDDGQHPALWNRAAVNYFDRLKESRAPAPDDYGYEMLDSPFEPVNEFDRPRPQPYRFRWL